MKMRSCLNLVPRIIYRKRGRRKNITIFSKRKFILRYINCAWQIKNKKVQNLAVNKTSYDIITINSNKFLTIIFADIVLMISLLTSFKYKTNSLHICEGVNNIDKNRQLCRFLLMAC